MTFRLRSGVMSFISERRGIAAVEFAVIFPLMLLFYIGIVDVTRGVIASRKLNLLSRTISDLVSQQPSTIAVPISKLSTILGSASAIMQPFPITSLTLTVSAVDIKAKSGSKPAICCDAVVRWSYTQGGSTGYLRTCGAKLTQVADGAPSNMSTFPQSLVTANSTQQSLVNANGYTTGQSSYIIVTDASYRFAPIFLQAVNWFSNGMGKTTYMVPRAPANPIIIADPSTATAPQLGCIATAAQLQ